MRCWLIVAILQAAIFAQSEPKRILYVTHSAGFRHDSLPLSQQVIRDIGARNAIDVVATEDLSFLDDMSRYDAVVFFTSGELALSAAQKTRLLDYVRSGRGFAGFHSATDTLYTWPEYGDLIGARFDGHPWTQQVRIDVEDPEHLSVKHLTPGFAITDEIYQFRDFDRQRVRVLMTLDTSSVDPHATGVNRTDKDFALAWVRDYGAGRVFYSALGHFDETWRDPRFQTLIEQTLLWITSRVPGNAQPRATGAPSISTIGNAATMEPRNTIAPGSLVSIYGTNLTSGSSMSGTSQRLAGTRVLLNGEPARLIYASPTRLNIYASPNLTSPVELRIEWMQSPGAIASPAWANATPGIFTSTVDGRFATLWATGLHNVRSPRVTVNGIAATVLYAGPAPGFPGLDQINIEIPASVNAPYTFAVQQQ